MKKNQKKSDTASTDLFDIVKGFSILSLEKKTFFFKHPLFLDIIEVEAQQEIDIKKSISSGISSSEELIESAIKNGSWSIEQDDKLKSLEWMIKKSHSSLAKISDPTQRKVFNLQIKNQEKEISELRKKRSQITNYSAEHLAEVKRVKRTFDKCVFTDRDFTSPPDETKRRSLTMILFSRYNELLSQERILNASYHGGFFDLFVTQEQNSLKILDTNIHKITQFQKALICLSNALFNKMKNTSIPEEIYGDPVKMMEYEESKQGEHKKVSHGIDDLKQKLKSRDGNLKAEDFLS